MASQQKRDLDRRLQELEREVNQTVSSATHKVREAEPLQRAASNARSGMVPRARDWFEQLPQLGKIAVIAGGAIVGFSLLKTVLQLVTSLLTLALVAGALYVGYRLFLAPERTD